MLKHHGINMQNSSYEDFRKEFTEQAAATLFQLVWGTVKQIGSWVKRESEVRTALQRYAINYDHRYGQINVLGMGTPLPLHLIFTRVHVVAPDFLHRYVKPSDLQRLFMIAGRHQSQFSSENCCDGIVQANESRFLNVLGAPGSGKSTFLRRIGQEALLDRRRFTMQRRPKWLVSRYKHLNIPVLIELRSFRGEDTRVDLIDAIVEEFKICGFPYSRRFVELALRKGQLLVIIDGIDEVPDSKLDKVLDEIRNLVSQYSENRFITSCRTAHYHNYFKQFTTVVLSDFSNEQIGQFAANWFRAEGDLREKTSRKFLARLNLPEHAASRELARTPLLLTFLCLTYSRHQQLPVNLASLYGDALNILLREWAAEKRVHNDEVYSDLHHELELLMLSEVAADLFDQNRYFFTRDEVIGSIQEFVAQQLNQPATLDAGSVFRAIEEQQGLIVKRTKDQWSFSHLTIQEYLTARFMSRGDNWRKIVDQHLLSNLARWTVVFRVLAGMPAMDTDLLLLSMARRIARECRAIPSVADLLCRVADAAKSPAEAGAERSLVSRVAFIALAVDQTENAQLRILARKLAFEIGLRFDVNVDQAQTYNLDLDYDLDVDVVRELGLSSVADYGDEPKRMRDVAIAQVTPHRIISYMLNQDLCSHSAFGSLVKCEEELTAAGRDADARRRAIRKFGQGLGFWEWDNVYITDLEGMASILEACRLLVGCQEASFSVTAGGWEKTCNVLFRPSEAGGVPFS